MATVSNRIASHGDRKGRHYDTTTCTLTPLMLKSTNGSSFYGSTNGFIRGIVVATLAVAMLLAVAMRHKEQIYTNVGEMMANSSYDSDRSTRFTRKSLRLKKHNYGWSATYFVTIRAAGFEMLFEDPTLHTILEWHWYSLPQRFPSLTLDEFIIMPNHVHCIVKLEGNVEKPTTLGRVMGAYKSLAAVTWLHHIESLGGAGLELSGQIWQRDFYEYVIPDAFVLEQKRQYIRENPIRWKQRHENIGL